MRIFLSRLHTIIRLNTDARKEKKEKRIDIKREKKALIIVRAFDEAKFESRKNVIKSHFSRLLIESNATCNELIYFPPPSFLSLLLCLLLPSPPTHAHTLPHQRLFFHNNKQINAAFDFGRESKTGEGELTKKIFIFFFSVKNISK